MQFSTLAILSIASSALASYNSTVTDIGTTIITVTSCHEDKCTEVPVTTGILTVTEEFTTYTTYCPLTSEEEGEKTTVAGESSTESSAAPSTHANATVSSYSAGAGKMQVGGAVLLGAALLL
ncbi:uncharacterized protein KGF55_002757 [Candida pseudojiufengensis]|uniref:uncharacterized protein n=1 Tax=Candida pseudojiufengensis TaxID=497109 RepID=UPI0022253354|nr:uncharacterized protein KGF55_002757 [Candida pseudojiufengensis]KAI5962965.1 hypothetical protein KGF55_002757 [Candida pseudojiufengensis]